MWNWDQGRLSYFSIKNIREIAKALESLNGADLTTGVDPLRAVLPMRTALPFKPDSYTVWRNYGRVFKLLGLASKVEGHLVTTDLCRLLCQQGDNFVTYDEYLTWIVNLSYAPNPAFSTYSHFDHRTFPLCAILKLLIIRSSQPNKPYVEVSDIFNVLIANKVEGTENLSAYSRLEEKTYKFTSTQERQAREMLIFLSNFSFLFWGNKKLFIESGVDDSFIKPMSQSRLENSEHEIQNVFSNKNLLSTQPNFNSKNLTDNNADDLLFTEGKKVRVSHLRTERNRKVVKFYFQHSSNPKLCDMCQTETSNRYPWVENLIEVHHVLPLSSAISLGHQGTTIKDLVGLCPNCHRATHLFYKLFLKTQEQSDFASEDEARNVYLLAKKEFNNSV